MQNDYSPHGRLKERRFDVPAVRPLPGPHDVARAALEGLPGPQRDLLTRWVAEALMPSSPRPGGPYPGGYDPPSGQSRTDELAKLAAVDIGFQPTSGELKGALLASGIWPTMGTSSKPVWAIGAEYIGGFVQ